MRASRRARRVAGLRPARSLRTSQLAGHAVISNLTPFSFDNRFDAPTRAFPQCSPDAHQVGPWPSYAFMLSETPARQSLDLYQQFALHLQYYPFLSFKPTLRTCPLKKSKQYRVSLSPLSKHRVMTLAFQREGPHTDADLSFSYPIDPPLVHMLSVHSKN
ncbi:hypothetical protein PCASD_26500 [Puccinia coronata f. sp. avenae]|uniref:Uncharacterized protein n=1 Tax=Puccinia coronata f. sp. avenae TaxID=200324 RepID=A0A2N5RUC3_9BASI|nr:hypothetical protein PCASD_26500 [Puccinia coronata f. sp. avenae]